MSAGSRRSGCPLYYDAGGKRHLEDVFELAAPYADYLEMLRGSFAGMSGQAIKEIIDLTTTTTS